MIRGILLAALGGGIIALGMVGVFVLPMIAAWAFIIGLSLFYALVVLVAEGEI